MKSFMVKLEGSAISRGPRYIFVEQKDGEAILYKDRDLTVTLTQGLDKSRISYDWDGIFPVDVNVSIVRVELPPCARDPKDRAPLRVEESVIR